MNIILSPHFDDAVLSLGGLLAQEGTDTLVATFFAGTPSVPLIRKWDITCGFTDSDQAMRERTEENRESLHSFGIDDDRIRNYTHLDAQYRLVRGAPVPPEPELDAAIEKEISALLQEFASEPLKVFIPGIGIHTDHRIVKDAALSVVRTLPPKDNIKFLFYQDLPYASNILERENPRTIWNFFMHKNAYQWDYSSLEQKITRGSFNVLMQTIPLSRADMKKKLAGVELYPSQANHLDNHLLKKLERFAAAQAQYLSLSAPYCEVGYTLVTAYDLA